MPVNLSIKDVPDALAERLRVRAAQHHRSLQGELMAIIERVVSEESQVRASDHFQVLEAQAARRGGKTIEQIAAAQRLRFPKAIQGGPRAVDIIRADRDSR